MERVPRALVVDDEPEIRALVRRTLEDAFDVVEAPDGARALALAAESMPDLVVLDWQMPGISGPEVLTFLLERRPDLPVIMLTAALGADHGSIAGIFGAAAFIAKPFSPGELLETAMRLAR